MHQVLEILSAAKDALPVGGIFEMHIGGKANTRYKRVGYYKHYDGFFLCFRLKDGRIESCTGGQAIEAGDAGFRIDFAPHWPQWTAKSQKFSPLGEPLALMNKAIKSLV